MTANERILALVKPEYLERIPSFIRSHATGKTCQLIAREFSEIYEVFSAEEEPDDHAKQQMAKKECRGFCKSAEGEFSWVRHLTFKNT